MDYVIKAAEPVVIPVQGSDKGFPVRRVFCIGKNYAAHVREMGSDPAKQPPVFFMKAADCVVPSGGDVPYPPATGDLHYEGEMVVALQGGGRDLDAASAEAAIYGYAAGIDFTRRDLQAVAKQKGLPWDMAKSFDGAAPVGALRSVQHAGHPAAAELTLSVNGVTRQQGTISDMVWPVVPALIALSRLVALKSGDLLFTGTPEGVGSVKAGDTLVCAVAGVGDVTVTLS